MWWCIVFLIHRDKDGNRDDELGMLFIEAYRNDEKYNSAAYFMALDMGSRIRRLHEPSDFWVYSLEQVESPVGKWASSAPQNQDSARRILRRKAS